MGSSLLTVGYPPWVSRVSSLQMGVGGIANPAISFDPTQIAGLVLWLDASQISGFASGASLSVWTDLSGQGNHMTNSLVTQQPVYTANKQNGLAMVTNNVNSATFGLANSASVVTQAPISIVGVSAITNSGNFQLFGNGKYATGSNGTTAPGFTLTGIVTVAGNPGYWSGTTPIQHSLVWESGSVLTVSFYKGGSLNSATTRSTEGATPASYFTTVAIWGSQSLLGDMGEFIVYKTALSASDRTRLESYLTTKWGTA